MTEHIGNYTIIAKNFCKNNPQLFSVLLIGLLSFILFYILFEQVSINNYFKEIIAALMATLLTVTITTLLLKAQTSSEERKERNISIFNKKVSLYEAFLSSAIDALDDNDLSAEEVREIKKRIYNLSLFSSPDTIDAVTRFMRFHSINDVDPVTVSDLVSAFRAEIDRSNEFGSTYVDLEFIDNAIIFGYEDRKELEKVRDLFYELHLKIYDLLRKGARPLASRDLGEIEPSLPEGSFDGIGSKFDFLNLLDKDTEYHTFHLDISYPKNRNFEILEVQVLINVYSINPSYRDCAVDAAKKIGFEHVGVGSEPAQNFTYFKDYILKTKIREDGKIYAVSSAAAKSISSDIINFGEHILAAKSEVGL